MKEAMYYKKLKNNLVECNLCFRNCIIAQNRKGFCGVRKNIDGKLYSLVWGKLAAIHVDPIEKEPVYHFYPGENILCIATLGCSFRCKFCHNWHISHASAGDERTDDVSPEEIVEIAKKHKVIGISTTYVEPAVFYEYMLDVYKISKKKGLKNIMHTCGSMQQEPFKELLKYLDAVTVDLKSFNDEFYEKMIGAKALNNVLENLKLIKKSGKHLEIVNLIIPTLNDDEKDIREMCIWIKENLGDDIPLHFSRYFPTYKFTLVPPTPIETLEKAYKIAKSVGLKYVSLGNVPGHKYNSTFCPKCNKIVIKRVHFDVLEKNIKDGKCKFCGEKIYGEF